MSGERPERGERARQLDRLPKSRLIAMYRAGVLTPDGGIRRYGGSAHPIERWSKQEVINSILSAEYDAAEPDS